jgi:hypothetical protein
MLKIITNGSKWCGEQPDDLPALFTVLTEHPLDPNMEGAYTSLINQTTHFHGNFLTVSHAFHIHTDEPAIIDQLTAAIITNHETFSTTRHAYDLDWLRKIKEEHTKC